MLARTRVILTVGCLLVCASVAMEARANPQLPGEMPQLEGYGPPTGVGDGILADPAAENDSLLREFERRLQALENGHPPSATTETWRPVSLLPTVSLHGRIHTDIGFFHQSESNRNAVGDIQDGVDFRRVRLAAMGDIGDFNHYVLDLDFATGIPRIMDMFIGWSDLPVMQTVQVGHFREPFGLEMLTSSNSYTLMERGSPTALVPFRNWGACSFQTYADDNVTLAAGVFREGTNVIGAQLGDEGGWAGTTRMTWLPWYDEASEGRHYWHVGHAYSFRDAQDREARFLQTPEGVLTDGDEFLIPPFVDTGVIPCVNFHQCGLESAWVFGPLSLQSEWMGTWVNQLDGPPLFFHGAYGYVSYFLTGEHRRYLKQRGSFDLTRVDEPFFRVRTERGLLTGTGAWEIALRLSYLDLSDNGLPLTPDGRQAGGRLTDLTLGLNWYLNDYVRIQANYIHAMLDDPNFGRSEANLFLTRFSLYW